MADKHGDPESEYFARLNREQQAKLAEELAGEKQRADRATLKTLHAAHCGKCGGLLVARGFRGVEIDVCEDCGAVLLDPGELQQLAGADDSGTLGSLARLFSFNRK